jgi:hypothetical protein
LSTPVFAEANHSAIRALQHHSDLELVMACRQEPPRAKFFVCRYSDMTYSIIEHMATDRRQIDHCFAQAWQHIFRQLQALRDGDLAPIVWQHWLVNQAGEVINAGIVPPAQHITADLAEVAPPLRCYVERSLRLMPPLLRLIFMMVEYWQWSPPKILAQLRSLGEDISDMDLPLYISESQAAFTRNLPEDLLDIYPEPSRLPESILAEDSLTIDTLGNIVSRKPSPFS